MVQFFFSPLNVSGCKCEFLFEQKTSLSESTNEEEDDVSSDEETQDTIGGAFSLNMDVDSSLILMANSD